MNLHQYRVLKDLAAKPTTTEEEQEAIEEAIVSVFMRDYSLRCKCGSRLCIYTANDEYADTICRVCADKGE